MTRLTQLTFLAAVVALPACASAPAVVSGAPDGHVRVDAVAPVAPMVQGGARHLVYELEIVNDGAAPVAVTSVRVEPAGVAARELAGETLRAAVAVRGEPKPAPPTALVPVGGVALVYLWVEVAEGEALPGRIAHTVRLDHADGGTEVLARTLEVVDAAPRVFRAPLDGEGWFVANAPKPTSRHRRSVQVIGERRHMAQRYALDFVRVLGPEGTHVGDPADNASYHAYGATVRAMAAGEVIAVVDGIPENVPGPDSRAVEMNLETLAGNAVVVDHGEGYVATYAHLIPGRLEVAVGQRVEAGAALGYVGNSGNSTEPHLHLHVCDAPALLACQGRPYAFDRFVEIAIVTGPNDAPRPLPPAMREAALPVDQAWLTLGDAATGDAPGGPPAP